MITITPEEITQFRSQLAHSPEALAALDAIAECEGYVEDAVPLVFMWETAREADRSLNDWVERCRQFICQENVRDALESGLIAPVVEQLAMSVGIPVATATALSLLVFKLGAKKFCKTPESGDNLFATKTPSGYEISVYDSNFVKKIEAARRGMKKYRNALLELAK